MPPLVAGANIPKVPFDELAANEWSLVHGEEVSSRRFTILGFCLIRDGHRVKYVQGYGRTLQKEP